MLNVAEKLQRKVNTTGAAVSVTGDEEYVMVDVEYSPRDTKPALMNKATRALVGLDKDSLFHVGKPVLEGMVKHPNGAFKSGVQVYEFNATKTENGNYKVA